MVNTVKLTPDSCVSYEDITNQRFWKVLSCSSFNLIPSNKNVLDQKEHKVSVSLKWWVYYYYKIWTLDSEHICRLEVKNFYIPPISCQFRDNNLPDKSYNDKNGKTSWTFVTMLNVIRKLLLPFVGELSYDTYKTEQLWRLLDGWLWHVRRRKNATDTEQHRNMQLFTGNAEMHNLTTLSHYITLYNKTRDHQLPSYPRVPNFPRSI